MRSRTKIRLHLAAQLLLATWILWVGNAYAFRHSWRLDLTRDQRHAIAPETREFLKALPQRVDVVIPYSFGPSGLDRVQSRVLARAVRTFEEFELVNPYCRIVEHIHIGRQPLRWQTLREERGLDRPNQVYLFSGDRREVVTLDDMAEIAESRDGPVLLRERVPEALAAALERVVEGRPERIVFTAGHGETSVRDTRNDLGISEFVRDLRGRGHELDTVDLSTGATIPEDTAMLVVLAGRAGGERFTPFGTDARAEVERHLERGGALLAMLPFDGESGLESLLGARGIVPLPGLVNSPVRTAGDGMGVVQTDRFDEDHPITARLRYGADVVELNSTIALEVSGGATPLVLSGPDTWRDLALDGVRGGEEPPGPFAVAAASEDAGRMVAFGSWTPVLDVFYRGQTRRLVLNACDWLGGREGPTAGAGRADTGERVVVTAGVRSAFFWTGIVSLPASVLVIGILVWWLRRRSS